MEKELIFHILGIKETKEENVIRTAYMALLKQTNPEDDPEGFKRLREAYEAALAFARQKENCLEDSEDKSEVEEWLEQVRNVYEDMDLRRRKDEWEELFSDPVCEELDTDVEVKEQLLEFMMNHIYLPGEIWVLIDQTFHIIDSMEELKERFPVNFLNYVKFYIENDNFIPFELFQIKNHDKQNGDQYLEHYYAVKRKLDQGEVDGCLEALADLKVFGLYHPYEDVERIRYYLQTEQKELAAELGSELLSHYSADNYIKTWNAQALFQTGKKDDADALWQEVLNNQPLYYLARMGSIRCLMDKGDYYEAKERLQKVMDDSNQNEELISYLTECNNHLIEEYTERIKKGEPNRYPSIFDIRIDLGWCLFQNQQFEKAIKVAEGFQPDERSAYDFNNLYGNVLYHDKQYEKAKPYLENWLRLLEETVDDGTEKMQRRISKKFRALYILGSCLHELGEDEAAEEYLYKAVQMASNQQEHLGVMSHLAQILLQSKKYEKAVDICDDIVKEDSGYYPAYVTRQEACYELGKGQAVVEDYHQAVNIYPGYYKPYLLALQVFFYHNQYEDGKEVLERARENEVEFSDKMKLFELKVLRNLAKTMEERTKLKQSLKQLSKDIGKETDIEDSSEIEFEMALLDWDNNQLIGALEHLKKAAKENKERLQYRLLKGHVYLELERYQDALNEYQAAQEDYGEEPSLYYNRGICYGKKNKKVLANENFEKALEYQETYRDACKRVMDYYKELYNKYNRKEDMEKAISYISRELKEEQNCYFLIERGLLYLNQFRFEEAIADFEKALEDDSDDWAGNNNLGCCYKYLGQYEKAIEYFRRAAACMDEYKSVLPYSNMADCYETIGQYQKAISCYEKNLELFPEKISFWEEIGDLYCHMEDYPKARKAYKNIKTEDHYYKCMANVCEKNGQLIQAFWWFVRGLFQAGLLNGKNERLGRRWLDFADFAANHMPWITRYTYKKAIDCTLDLEDKFWYGQRLSTFYYRKKKFGMAKKWAENAMRFFKETGMAEENYLSYKLFAPARLRNMAFIYIALGETEIGEQYLAQMREVTRCRNCRAESCYEMYFYRGIYKEANDDLSGALQDYSEALEIKDSMRTRQYITILRKKMEKKK